jgi:hypothetical protein
MFVGEFSMTLADLDTRSVPSPSLNTSSLTGGGRSFLTTCARWIGEGPHLNLLDAILESGFDPTAINCPLWEQWPACCSPNWISEQHTPDPFFVEFLARLVKDNPGAY